MTAIASPATAVRSTTHKVVSRSWWKLAAMGFVFLLIAAGWTMAAHQHTLLWQRLPADAADRWTADRIAVPLPRMPALVELKGACGHSLSPMANWRRAWMRDELAQCLSDPAGTPKVADAQAAVAHFEAVLDEQIKSADSWLAAFDVQSPGLRRNAQAELAEARRAPTGALGWLAQWGSKWSVDDPTDVRENVGRPTTPNTVADRLRTRLSATRLEMQRLADSPIDERARRLGLLATGLQLTSDFGQSPPKAHLSSATGSLADALEWQRRSHGYAERGFSLSSLHAVPEMLLNSTLVLLAVAVVTSRGHAFVVGLWGLASLLLVLGSLTLTDLALTGDASLRYLADRQFMSFGLGDIAWNLAVECPLPAALGGGHLTFWWPLLVVGAAVALLGALRYGDGSVWVPVRAWVRWSSLQPSSSVQLSVLLALGAAAVMFLGMPAAVSELLIFLGCLGLATYLARQAPHANAGAGLQGYNLSIVAGAVALAMGGSLARGDLGHALVAAMLAAVFAWLFGGKWLRWTLAAVAAALASSLAMCLMQGKLGGPLAMLVDHLPAHAQDRFQAMFDVGGAASSDLARTRWLMQSAGTGGWGPGYVPWQGLTSARVQDGLPLQGPSDYVLSLVVALWGSLGGVALMAAVLLLFTGAAFIGLRTALRQAMPVEGRFLAGLGGFGCVVMAAKVLLSMGGVSLVLPLTGLPVALLGYGPVTHLAALSYLVLALGTAHLAPDLAQRGVVIRPQRRVNGAVRSRGHWVMLGSVAGICTLVVAGHHRTSTSSGPQAQRHVSKSRLELAQVVAQSLVPVANVLPRSSLSSDTEALTATSCPQLDEAVNAWNLRLQAQDQSVRLPAEKGEPVPASSLRLDPQRLLAGHPWHGTSGCSAMARTLGQMLETDLPRLIGRSAASVNSLGQAGGDDIGRLSAFEKARAVGARPLDYTTLNPWWGRPGCLQPADALNVASGNDANPCIDHRQTMNLVTGQGMNPLASVSSADLASDIWLQRELVPQLHLALRQPVKSAVVNHREIPIGPVLGLTLQPSYQQAAQRTVDCFAGRLSGNDCQSVLPVDEVWRQRHFGTDHPLRAGAAGLVMAEVDTGRIVAMAGSISDCTLQHLGQHAQSDAKGRLPALLEGQQCAQFPDRRVNWLALQSPLLWMVPPGSSVKPLSLMAAMDTQRLEPSNDEYWKRVLAVSHERLPVQRMALAAGRHYIDVLGAVGFDQGASDLMWGGLADVSSHSPPFGTQWLAQTQSGTQALRASSMTVEQSEKIRHEKLAGANVDKLYGKALMSEFVATRQVADAAVGGGDIRINAMGLLEMWRQIDLRARGAASAPATHLLEQRSLDVPQRSVAWSSVRTAARALEMTSGVSASAWGGTAQGSCRVVFGACPPQGLPQVSGKTGSADFLDEEDSPFVKPGMQLPAKLYGGVFTAPDGHRYAIAAMTLRVREGSSRALELKSSSAAEAAFTLMRQMGIEVRTKARP